MSEYYNIYKYTYQKGRVLREVVLGKDIGGVVEIKHIDKTKHPGSRRVIPKIEINNPCTNNINQGVYLLEDDMDFACSHFKRCIE